MIIGTDNCFIELHQYWSHFFHKCNWHSFTLINVNFEWERYIGGVSFELCILNIRAYFRWNYAPEKLQSFINPINDFENYTRFEIIDHRKNAQPFGRVMSLNNVSIDLSYQDGGNTLKVFIQDHGHTNNPKREGE